MMVEDRIADMLTRIRNANQMKYDTVEVLGSKMTCEIARILKEEGYISDYVLEEAKNGNKIIVSLKYTEGKKTRVITGLKRISKSGLRVYAKHDELPRVLNGLGIAIISTSEGIMTDRDARNKKLGGEVLAYIW
ncbi:MAG: 30S ribosomal protein S8 [Erysipelotrichales bacterium]|nr:30S ribosomal protein S8 [Erysipelotrichales bacterium]